MSISLSAAEPWSRSVRRTWPADALLLVSFVVVFGVVSWGLGVDANWDDRNYHQYNAYAALFGRYALDIAPAQLQTFIHPGQDIVIFLLRRALNSHPLVFAFVWAVPNGIIALLAYRIALLLQPNHSATPRLRAACAVLALVIGITGGAGFPSIGTSMSEMPAGCFIAAALLLLIEDLGEAQGIGRSALAGLFLGVATGIKLVEAIYFLGAAVALLAFVRSWADVGRLVTFGAAAILAVVVVAGPWSLHLYLIYGNPLFPYFNNIFRSPFAEFSDFNDVGGRPRDLLQAIAFPLAWTFERTLQLGGNYVRDARFSIFYICAVSLAVGGLARARQGGLKLSPADRRLAFFCIFFVTAFLLWECKFAILRYLSVLEILGGVLLFATLLRLRLFQRNAVALFTSLSVIMGGLWATTIYPDWGRAHPRKSLQDVRLPLMAKGAVVVLLSDFPMGYLAAHGQQDVRFIAGQNNFVYPWDHDGIDVEAARVVNGQLGELWGLEPAREPAEAADRTLAIFHLQRDGCVPVRSNLDQDAIKACRLRRIGAPPDARL